MRGSLRIFLTKMRRGNPPKVKNSNFLLLREKTTGLQKSIITSMLCLNSSEKNLVERGGIR
jgi:hypothetical protein